MKMRSITVGVATALMIGMLTAGTVNIVEAERQDRRRSHDRKERWDSGRERMRQRFIVEHYRQFWFNTTFMLELDDATLIRAKDVHSRALHDIKSNIDRKEIAIRFATNLKKTIGAENFEKLSKTIRSRRGRRDIKIGEQGRSRRKRGGKTGTHKTKSEKNG